MLSSPIRGNLTAFLNITGSVKTEQFQTPLHAFRPSQRQPVERRANVHDLRREAKAWEVARDDAATKVNWQFTTTDARIKLRRLYPSIDG